MNIFSNNAKACLFFMTLRVVVVSSIATAAAVEPVSPSGIVLFHGNNLDGWVNVNGAADTWKGRDGAIVCNGQPRSFLRTDTMFENYVLEVQWKHVKPGGNSGLFVHADAALGEVGVGCPGAVRQSRGVIRGRLFQLGLGQHPRIDALSHDPAPVLGGSAALPGLPCFPVVGPVPEEVNGKSKIYRKRCHSFIRPPVHGHDTIFIDRI